MIVENQFDCGAGRISGVNKFEEFDELSTAVAVSDQAVDLPREQINPGQQADSAVAFVLMIAREGRVNAGLGRQIGCCRCDGLDSRLFIVRDDRHRLVCFLRLGPFQNLDLAVNAQNFCHLLLELGVAPFQIVPYLVRLDFLLAKNLAHRALGQVGQTCVSRGRCVLARMARQQPRRPQLVRIPVLLGLVACQRHQPGLGLQRNRRHLARSGPVIE